MSIYDSINAVSIGGLKGKVPGMRTASRIQNSFISMHFWGKNVDAI